MNNWTYLVTEKFNFFLFEPSLILGIDTLLRPFFIFSNLSRLYDFFLAYVVLARLPVNFHFVFISCFVKI